MSEAAAVEVLASVNGLKACLLRDSTGRVIPSVCTDAELVALARSEALGEDMRIHELTAATSDVFLTHVNERPLLNPILIKEAMTPLRTAEAHAVAAGIAFPIQKIQKITVLFTKTALSAALALSTTGVAGGATGTAATAPSTSSSSTSAAPAPAPDTAEKNKEGSSGKAAAAGAGGPDDIVKTFAEEARGFDVKSLEGEKRVRKVTVELPGLGKKRIYIRHFFYPLMVEVLKATQASASGRNALIGGTPGIGKTTFGVVLVLVAVSVGKRCAYWNEQWRRGFIFSPPSELPERSGSAAFFIDYLAFETAAADFSTGDLYITDTMRPPMFDKAQIVVITSPRYRVWKDFVKCEREGDYPMTLTFPTFELEELEEMAALECVNAHASWKSLYELYGGVPRHVFSRANSGTTWDDSLGDATSLDLRVFRWLNKGPSSRISGKEAEKVPDVFLHFRTFGQTAARTQAAAAAAAAAGPSEVAHDAAAPLHPGQEEYYRFDGLVYASERAEEKLADALLQERRDDMLTLLGARQSLQHLAPVMGPIFERLTLQELATGSAKGWNCKRLRTSDCEVVKDGFSFKPSNKQLHVFHNLAELQRKFERSEQRKGLVLKPHSKTFPAVDAVLGDEGLVQVTLGSKHGVKLKGLRDTIAALGLGGKKVKLFFMVPEEAYTDGYRKCEPYLFDGKVAADEATTTESELVEQYAVCVPLALQHRLSTEGPPSKRPRTDDEGGASSSDVSTSADDAPGGGAGGARTA